MPSWVDILTGGDANIVLFRMWGNMEPCMKEHWAERSIDEMKRVERILGYRLIHESLLDGGSPILGRLLDLAQRATLEETGAFFNLLSPKCLLMAAYVDKQRNKLHVLVRFHDSTAEGKLAYYWSEENHLVLGKHHINPGSRSYPVRASYHPFEHL
ncbi:hypothetical protein OIDMADRAFT_35093 [Oidiodendron maius Zn]|uniref:Uncharacterized protein n=1 Tax=Oidiodendron maius (strain Zn) TaxID=913774 RepID=A0A0C3GRQ7_OIDMZ|nr:hypothetical protein OIDMADRAFT_35093 [Oidiodendron maius Zn]